MISEPVGPPFAEPAQPLLAEPAGCWRTGDRRVHANRRPYHAVIGTSEQGSSPPRLPVRAPAGIAAVAGIAAYAWWAAGLSPFTTAADVAVALPVAGLAVAAILIPTGPQSPRSAGRLGYRALPWVGILAVAVGLEAAGLALGGRSQTVPTLSTVVDHALAWQGVRFLLFLAWLALGWALVVRQASFARRPGT